MSFARATIRELRPTMRLAAPIAAGQVGQMLMGVTDTIMVGQVGTLALAACAFSNNVLMIAAIVGYGVLTAVSVRVAHAHGAGTQHAMARAYYAGAGLSVIGGIICAAGMYLFYPLFHHLGQAPGVVEEAEAYTIIVMWSLIPAWLIATARNYLDSQSRPWPSFWITLAGVLLNVLLNWILIFGNLGAPALGLAGAGWATLISRVATFAALTWFLLAGSSAPSERWRPDAVWWREQWAMLRLGMPTGLMLLSEVGAFSAAALLIGHLGAVPLAAHQIAITCASTTFMLPLGVAMASTVRIGQALGGGRRELLRPIGAGAWLIGLVVMAAFTVILVAAGPAIARAFVSDPKVIVIAAQLLVIAGVFQLVDGVQVIGSGLLRGLHDTKVPMWINLIAYWVIALPLGGWLAFARGEGAAGMWVGLAWGIALASVLLVLRFWAKTKTD